jgi:transposase
MVRRHELSDEQWERLQPLLPPQKAQTGRPAADHRRITGGS